MTNPIAQFTQWFTEASKHPQVIEPTAMTLATCAGNKPSARIVLLKAHDERGFVFYTNLGSRKSAELKNNPHAALCFHWPALTKQIRIEGLIEPVSDAEADAYFATRPRESQIGAWSSKQSTSLASREELLRAIDENTKKYEGKTVPRPPFWSGWRLVPERMEFWQQGDFRIHERELFTRSEQGWTKGMLYP